MSETTPTPEELIEEISFEIQDANVIPTPIDPTLSIEGEAADAKATGDAIAEVFTGAAVNGKSFTNKQLTLYGNEIYVSNAAGAQTIAQAIESAGDKDASGIMYDSTTMTTVKAAIDGIKEEIDTELTEDAIDAILAEVFGGEE